MKIRTTTVTPDLAQRWLNNTDRINRNLSRNRVDRFIHAIENGQWQLTHQPIALDADKNVLDGQHRLEAIAHAGKDVEALVAYDCDPSTFDVIDTGAARTAGDTLKIAGYTNANVLGAAARMLLTYDIVVGTSDSFQKEVRRRTTRDVVDLLATERGERLRNAMTPATRMSMELSRFGMKTWMSAAITLLYEDGRRPDTTAVFVEKLTNGIMLQEGSPILSLRRWIQGGNGLVNVHGTYKAQFGISNTIKAFNAFAAGRDVRLTITRRGEAMPRIIIPDSDAELIELEQQLERDERKGA